MENNNKKVAVILVNYKDYAVKYLADCWASLMAQDYQGEKSFFIVDNESSEESLANLRTLAPQANLIINKKNDGFAKGNNDALKIAISQGFDYAVLFNMDTVVEKDCLGKMIAIAESRAAGKSIGAVQARLMLYPEKDKINSLGNITHFLGFGYTDGYRERYDGGVFSSPASKDICYPSGAAVLYRTALLKDIGLFDEEFWMYNEDQDLGWRIWLSGQRCVLATGAVAYHKYEFSRSIKKYYWLDRNRLIAIIKNYHWATLALIFPAGLVMEAGLLFFSIKNGWFFEKIKVYNYFLSLKNWSYLRRARRQAQSYRRVKDYEIVKMFSGRIWYQEIGDNKLRIANLVFNFYWQIIKLFIRW